MMFASMSLLTVLMMPPLVITAMDLKLATTWLKLEVMIAAALIACIWTYSVVKRVFKKKQLRGSTVLITNGESALSKELAAQLTIIHRCRVLLLTNQGPTTTISPGIHQEYGCNVFNSAELQQLVGTILSELRMTHSGIDILIENALSSGTNAKDVDVKQFIERTSQTIMATINLLMNFIPVLAQSQRGHYVTIQPTNLAAGPFLETKSEVRDLIQHLQTRADSCVDPLSLPVPSSGQHPDDFAFRPPVKLSTIVLHNSHQPRDYSCPNGNELHLSVAEVAAQVIAGIRNESPKQSVNAKRSLIECSWRRVRRSFERR